MVVKKKNQKLRKIKMEAKLRLFSTGNNMNSLSGVSCLQLLVQFHLMPWYGKLIKKPHRIAWAQISQAIDCKHRASFSLWCSRLVK